MLCGIQKCYGGVRFPVDRPSPRNVLRLDMGALPMIVDMHQNGIYLDVPAIRRLDTELETAIGHIQYGIDTLAGKPLNPGSGDKVAKFLYGELGLDKQYAIANAGGGGKGRDLKSTPSRTRLSTDDETLSLLRHMDPIVDSILDHRELTKLRSTYTKTLPFHVNPHTQRVHTTFNATHARTGRLTSSKPNLQNIPARSDMGKEIRKCFTVQYPRTVMASLDLSQIEMVGAAHVSGDPKMQRVFTDGLDLHTFTAMSMFRLYEPDVQPDPEKYPNVVCPHADGVWPIPWKVFKNKYRLPAKTLGFGILYGVTPKGLQQQILSAGGPFWTIEECEEFIRGWYALYTGVYRWTCEQHSRVRRYDRVWDLFGRWRWIWEVKSTIAGTVSAGLRQAGNMPIQSVAQGFLKLAMAEIHALVQYYQSKGKICLSLLQIHDELMFELAEDIAEEFCERASRIMRNVVELDVPIGSSRDLAMTWGDLK